MVAPANGNFASSPAPAQGMDLHQHQQQQSPASNAMTGLPTAISPQKYQYALTRPGAGLNNGSDDDTEMMEAGGNALRQLPHPAAGQRHFPPPIDFTTSFRTSAASHNGSEAQNVNNSAPVAPSMTTSSHSNQLQDTSSSVSLAPISPHLGDSPQPHSQNQRKRSLSIAEVDNLASDQRLHSINSILNPRSQHQQINMGDVPIEPSLLALGSGELTDDQRRSILLQRRHELERESKRIKEDLEACERELQKLGGDKMMNGVVGEDSGGGNVNMA